MSGGDGVRKNHERHLVTLHVDLKDLLSGEAVAKISGGGITGIDTVKKLLGRGVFVGRDDPSRHQHPHGLGQEEGQYRAQAGDRGTR